MARNAGESIVEGPHDNRHVIAVADRDLLGVVPRVHLPRAPARRPTLGHRGRPRGVRRRFAPHQLRHAHAVESAREGVPLIVIQRQLGQSNLGITSVYLQGIDNAEIIETVHARRAPMIPVSASLRL